MRYTIVMPLPPQERYVFKPSVGSSHAWALQHLSRVPADAAVLDVGPGSCAMGSYLKERGCRKLFAVEPDPSARAHAAGIYAEAREKLEEISQPSFDMVLLLDVLEHMADPGVFLRQVTARMNPEAAVLISVPNVAHWSVRLSLLCGRFEYSERGILDRTHLQFFTRRRLNRFLGDLPELSVVERRASIAPYELLLPGAIGRSALFLAASRVRLAAAGLLPGPLAYQHLVAARRLAGDSGAAR